MSKKKQQARMESFNPADGREEGSRTVSMIEVSRMVRRRLKISPVKKIVQTYLDVLKFAFIPVAKCAINYDRQRQPELKHIEKVYKNWNLQCVTPLQARYSKKDDTYYIADGQQHGIAWVLKYGEDSTIPVFYIESEDVSIETVMLLALNNDNEPMAKYFIHKQKCIMKDEQATAIELAVNNANCRTAYKKKGPGYITHITHLYLAESAYGVKNIENVLIRMRRYWPDEIIYTATMLGFLKLKELMETDKVYSDALFEEVFYAASEFFDSSERLHLDIKDQFEEEYPTNYKGIGVREKIASGIIDAYQQVTGKTFPVEKPFDISMTWIKDPPATTTQVEDLDEEEVEYEYNEEETYAHALS